MSARARRLRTAFTQVLSVGGSFLSVLWHALAGRDARAPRELLRSLRRLLYLVFHFEVERELDDGLDDDRVDDRVEAVGVERVEEEGSALARAPDRVLLLEVVAVLLYVLGLVGGVGVVHLGRVVDARLLRVDLRGRAQAYVEKALVARGLLLDDLRGLLHEAALHGGRVGHDVVHFYQVVNLRLRREHGQAVEHVSVAVVNRDVLLQLEADELLYRAVARQLVSVNLVLRREVHVDVGVAYAQTLEPRLEPGDGRVHLLVALGDGRALLKKPEDRHELVCLNVHEHARVHEHRGRRGRLVVLLHGALAALVGVGARAARPALRVAYVAARLREAVGRENQEEGDKRKESF